MTTFNLIHADVLHGLEQLDSGSVHACVTSPPYYKLREYNVEGQIGQESSISEYVERLVGVFSSVRRVLRKDGTLWLNLGDTFNGHNGKHYPGGEFDRPCREHTRIQCKGKKDSRFKDRDLLGIPWRVAMALQADGWWLRSAIIWAKGESFNPDRSGAIMPQSQDGWRWEQHRVKVGIEPSDQHVPSNWDRSEGSHDSLDGRFEDNETQTKWEVCPGCEKCLPNGGLVLRRGSWRPDNSYEMVFLLATSDTYFVDAVREPSVTPLENSGSQRFGAPGGKAEQVYGRKVSGDLWQPSGTRNVRDVWQIGVQNFPDAHFATFPEALVQPCIDAGTSAKGCCPECGSQWARVVERGEPLTAQMQACGADSAGEYNGSGQKDYEAAGAQNPSDMKARILAGMRERKTTGWLPTCDCHRLPLFAAARKTDEPKEPVPCTVLDPFCGSGTVGAVALPNGRNFVGIDLNEDYIELSRQRIEGAIETYVQKND